MDVKYAGKTMKSSLFQINQDSFATGDGLWDKDSGYLFVVCDGQGYPRQIDSASTFAAETIISRFYSAENRNRLETLLQVIEMVNLELHEKFQTSITTLVAALIHQEKLYVAHVGNSRAYLIKNGEVVRLTTDHTLGEELIKRGEISKEERSKFRGDWHLLLRALGGESTVNFDDSTFELQGDEIVILCTDGVWKFVEAEMIQQSAKDRNCREIVEKLTEVARKNGTLDDATVIVVKLR